MTPGEFYRQEVLPRLAIDQVYSDVAFRQRGSRWWRGPCPRHGGDNPTAFAVEVETLRWTCYTACAESGDALTYINGWEPPRGRAFVEAVRTLALVAGVDPSPMDLKPHRKAEPSPFEAHRAFERRARRVPVPSPRPAVEPSRELSVPLGSYRQALPGSPGAQYLQRRAVPLEWAQGFGLGYAAPGTWLNPGRDCRWGRLVVPHTDPEGDLLNLYGRAVGPDARVSRALRHDHLPGGKGYFNASALRQGSGPLYVCEGVFDALSLLLAGCPRAVAIFGVNGWRWDWARAVSELVFALDEDAAGRAAWRRLAWEGRLRGKRVARLSSHVLGGKKDPNEAWCSGVLTLLPGVGSAAH